MTAIPQWRVRSAMRSVEAFSPTVVVFEREIERQRDRRGTGTAYVLDRSGAAPDTVHLHLDGGGAEPEEGHRSSIPLDWSYGDFDESTVRPEGDFVRLAIDDTTVPMRASCEIRVGRRTVNADVSIVATGANSFSRNAGVLETDALLERSVLCIGLGSGGSAIVDQLARSGIGQFILWDNDRLETHNVSRHVCTLRDVGRLKVNATRDHVLAINPDAKVVTVCSDVTADPGELEEYVRAADCILAATDNNESRFAINEAAVLLQKPVYFGRAFTRACGGDVIQVVPGADGPCYACHAESRIVDEEVSSARDADRIAYADREVPIEPGLNIDISPIANMVARLVLLRLAADAGSALAETTEELDAPLYLWANQRKEEFKNWQPMRRSFNRMSILRWYAVNVPKNTACMVCGTGSVP